MSLSASQVAPLGRRGLTVTRLGLGTGPMGLRHAEPGSDVLARALVRRAWDHGLRFFDSAPLYGFGFAERCVGEELRERPRDAFVLSTKVGRLVREPAELGAQSTTFDFSARGVRRSLEASLERLQLDRVDVAFVHDPDDHFEEALRGALPELVRLRDSGVIGALGVGMNQAEMPARFVNQLDVDCVLLAGKYTLLDQSGLAELLPLCEARQISVVVGAPFGGGILVDIDDAAAIRKAPPLVLERIRSIRSVCERHNVPLKSVALQFPFGHPAVETVLTGPRTVPELDENVRMLEWEIPAALWSDLHDRGLIAEDAPTPPQRRK